jgi:hypothetical protein
MTEKGRLILVIFGYNEFPNRDSQCIMHTSRNVFCLNSDNPVTDMIGGGFKDSME